MFKYTKLMLAKEHLPSVGRAARRRLHKTTVYLEHIT